MFYLALRHALHHWVITLLMVAGMTLVLAFPVVVSRAATVAEEQYMARARATPLVIGRRANAYLLTLNTLYFEGGAAPPTVARKVFEEVNGQKAGLVVPVLNRLTVRELPLIGTTIDYFQLRKLELAEGEVPLLLGDCVVGAEAARRLTVRTGGALHSDIATFLDVAHEYPFKLNVVGVLKSSGSPDDRAVFIDLKTAWTIEGLGHGHENAAPNAPGVLGTQTPAPEEVNAQVQAILGKGVSEFREVTPENIKSFHFHGDMNAFPLTAVIVAPSSEKSGTMLKAAVNTKAFGEDVEAVVPEEIVGGLMRVVFNVKKIFDSYFVMTACGVGAFLAIIVMLSVRNRRDEFAVMTKMGCSRGAIVLLFVYEFAMIFTVSAGLSLGASEVALVLLRRMI